MTTSGTYNYALDFGGVVREAWERCQLLAESQTGWQLRSARQSLNLMLVEWAARGINLWAVEKVVVSPLTVGAQTITTAIGTLDILEVTISTTTPITDERPATPLSRDEYVAYPNKGMRGRPSQYWVERVAPSPVLHVWPTPDAAATYTLTYYRMRMLQDVSAGAQTVDIPPVFIDALVSGLAARIAGKWVKDASLRNELRQIAAMSFKEAFSQDVERVNISFKPDMSGWGWN